MIELLTVVVVLAAVAIIVFPGFFDIRDTRLRSDARRLSALVRFLDEGAATRKVYYRLWFDLEKERLRVDTSKNGVEYAPYSDSRISSFTFARGVDIKYITVPGLGDVLRGEVAVTFTPIGAEKPFAVHLRSGDSELTVDFNPYSGNVRVLEGDV